MLSLAVETEVYFCSKIGAGESGSNLPLCHFEPDVSKALFLI